MTELCKCGHEKSRHELGSGRCGYGIGLSPKAYVPIMATGAIGGAIIGALAPKG